MASCPACCARGKVRGFSLVELLIAAAIGLTLLSALIPVLLAHRTAFGESQRFGELQETMAFAVDYLSRDLRGARSVTWADNALHVRRQRDMEWCGLPAGEAEIIYFVQAGGLRCRDGVTENHELLVGMKPGSRLLVSGLPPDTGSAPSAVQLTLVFASVSGLGGEVHEHELSFRIALRNQVLSP